MADVGCRLNRSLLTGIHLNFTLSLYADLSTQIQRLLVDQMPSTPATSIGKDIIGDQLLTFGTVKELQEQNAALVMILRRLSSGRHILDVDAVDEFSTSVLGDAGSSASLLDLELANTELAGLRDARCRTEAMVTGLIQQRDMYRVMLEEVEKTSTAAESSSPLKLSRISLGSPLSKARDTESSGQQTEAQVCTPHPIMPFFVYTIIA